jgi:FAD/FMN-containing dehydrogenase
MRARLESAIEAALGPGRLTEGEPRDLGGRDLGAPAAWVRPASTAEVAALVRVARETKTPLVAVGRRTSYWRALSLEGAIAVDLEGMASVGAVRDGVVRVEGGASVRAIDDVLRAAGATMVAWPDAYGDTSIGAMVATGFSSGVGMACVQLDDLVAGLTVVLGTGEVITTGAAAALGATPFLRAGLPDPTSLFFASEGALGVVTEVAVRGRPRLHRCRIEARSQGFGPCVALARSLRSPGLYETFRCVHRGGGEVEVDLVAVSPLDREELDRRVEAIGRGLAIARTTIERPDEATIPRFWGEPHEHREHFRHGRFCGLDVNVPWSAAEGAVAALAAIAARARSLPRAEVREVAYFAPGFANVGMHCVLDPATSDAAIDALTGEGAASLAALEMVPYRWGRAWGVLAPKLDGGYAQGMRRLRAALDPDSILNPGVSIFGAITPVARAGT